ncbi:MAG: energy-coupling factor ABC transporter ATP-binding protein [Promethearchaeota archaeon]
MYIVEVNNLGFKYQSDFSLINLSFKIEEKSIYALTGNNGSGKTTLLRLLVGLLKPMGGDIKIFGETLTRNKKQLWKIRQKIGFLFQNPDDQLFAPTIEEDISFGARNLKLYEQEVQKRTAWALEAVGLTGYKQYSPFQLSWGQKKRAALAGLLVMKPKLLILDEPFANLDFKSIYAHLEIIEKLRREEQMTILFTTHNLFFVESWADRMLLIDNGKKIFEGAPKEGLNRPEVNEILGNYDLIQKLILKNKLKKNLF